MYRIRIAPEAQPGEIIALATSEAHYVAHVLRMRPGEEVEAFDGVQHTYRLRLTAVSSGAVEGAVVSRSPVPVAAEVPLTLGQAVPKGAKMELIVEKCSELGLTTLVPLYTERTVVRARPERLADRLARWRRIAEAAARQCGRPALLDVQAPMSLADFCAHYQTVVGKIVCWEQEPRCGLRQALNRLDGKAPIVVLIGPEGGWTPAEIALARARGFVPVHLGPRILRTETAAIAVTGIVRYHLGDLAPQEAVG